MLRQQADQETNTEACYQAALLYIDGVGVETNFRNAIQYMIKYVCIIFVYYFVLFCLLILRFLYIFFCLFICTYLLLLLFIIICVCFHLLFNLCACTVCYI